MNNQACPCGSGKIYKKCCSPFHEGALPNTALELMRSRYSAYAMRLPQYIIKTTHLNNPNFQTNTEKWTREIEMFADLTTFKKLEIIDCSDQNKEATVTFKAHLIQNGLDTPLTEKSYFENIDGQWLYLRGEFL